MIEFQEGSGIKSHSPISFSLVTILSVALPISNPMSKLQGPCSGSVSEAEEGADHPLCSHWSVIGCRGIEGILDRFHMMGNWPKKKNDGI